MPGFRLKGAHRLFVTGSVSVSGTVGAPTPSPAPPPALSALDWLGDGKDNSGNSSRRMIVWQNPQNNGLPIYGPTAGGGATQGITYLWRCKPFRKDTTGSSVARATTNPRYWSAFFWGNSNPDGGEWTTGLGGNGIFQWNGGQPDTYYGAHPYPDGGAGAPFGIPQYPEISVQSFDFTTHNVGGSSATLISPGAVDQQLNWGAWQWHVLRVKRNSSSQCTHEYFWQFNVNTSGLSYTLNDSGWAASNPPHPCVTFGQSAWVTYAGNEEFCGLARGLIIVPKAITNADATALIANNYDADVKATIDARGLPTEWFLNMNPTVADISDKGRGAHDPIWVGNGRPNDVLGG